MEAPLGLKSDVPILESEAALIFIGMGRTKHFFYYYGGARLALRKLTCSRVDSKYRNESINKNYKHDLRAYSHASGSLRLHLSTAMI